jgi:hypothetical protein
MGHPMTTFVVAVGFASTVGYLLMLRAQNRRAQDLLMSRLQGGRDRRTSKRDSSTGDSGDYSSDGGWSFSNWFGHSDSSGSPSDSCGSSDSGDSGSSGDCGGGDSGGGGDGGGGGD